MRTQQEYEQFVNRTSRSSGAVGNLPLCYRWARLLMRDGIAHGARGGVYRMDPGEWILDWGCGKGAKAAVELKGEGFKVLAYDIGKNRDTIPIHMKAGNSDEFRLVILSNVLNVQPTAEQVEEVLNLAWARVVRGGYLILNYPIAPRHNPVCHNKVVDLIQERTNDWLCLQKHVWLMHKPFEDFH